MLAASSSAPNSPRSTPKPSNWRGVAEGLAAAKRVFASRELDTAEEILREVLEFAPAETKAWAWLGKVLLDKGDEAEAEACFERARQLLKKKSAPTTAKPAASATLARLLWQQGDRDTARSMLALLLIQRPDDAELHRLKERWTNEDEA